MNDIFKKIDNAKHIEIVVEEDSLFVASALYTYILTLHKKVSLVCKNKEINRKYSFLPWFEKIKKSDTPSADITINLTLSALNLFDYFQIQNIKINKKMATALYGDILDKSDGFKNNNISKTFFDTISQLIKYGADYKLCQSYIIEFVTLALLRLKSNMLQNMTLVNSATVAIFYIDDDILKATGAKIEDAKKIIKEAFGLPYVEMSVLLKSDEENEIIKIVNKDI